MNCSDIVLENAERKALETAERGVPLPVSDASKRLANHGFVRYVYNACGNALGYVITDDGHNYLASLRNHVAGKRTETRRYWITTVIAVIALLKAFMPEIVAGLELVWTLLKR